MVLYHMLDLLYALLHRLKADLVGAEVEWLASERLQVRLFLDQVHFAGKLAGHIGKLRHELLNVLVVLLSSRLGIVMVRD